MPVNDRILYTDYNTMQTAVANILGGGSGNFGYGQITQSSAVSGANGTGVVLGGGTGATKIGITEYTKLRSDILNVYRHIYGTDATQLAEPTVSQIIRYVVGAGATTTEWGTSEYNVAEFNATTINASDDPYTQYTTFINDITNSRFQCATSQSLTEPKGSVQRTTSWGVGSNTISTRVRVTFTSAAAARYFFNSGGEIRISSTRAGGAGTSQNSSWSSLLAAAATQTFSAQLPSTTLTGTLGQNWFTLSGTYQTWYSTTDSSPYGSNSYSIQARTLNGTVANNNTGTSLGVDLLVRFTDNYRDNFPRPAPDDVVDGTLTVSVTLKRATGVLQPEGIGLGNFIVESPSVDYFGGSSATANAID